ncbi:transcriptional regulator [Natrinema sp. SYSU A 869]|uniref:transcriptional regulator n=1 Tax=Natrinema sp. SYSU A 869 TaxID=2871694 RepID=UPI001CA3DC1A|nr:transcriptional regulator [Natrinema sp. SYSU A 869]
MQLPSDERILEVLYTSNLILSPAVVGKNIETTRVHINRRLSVLVDYGVVHRVERGYYKITESGVEYLEGELDAGELEADGE